MVTKSRIPLAVWLKTRNRYDIVVGIDPGSGGAIAVWRLYSDKIDLHYMPLFKFPGRLKKKKSLSIRDRRARIDLRTLWDILQEPLLECDAERVLYILEDTHARQRDGKVQAHNFGYARGVIEGMLIGGLGVHPACVLPTAWRTEVVGKGTDKDASRKLAQARFKGYTDLKFDDKKSEALAEALLLAEYGIMHRREMRERREAWPLSPQARQFLAKPVLRKKSKKPSKSVKARGSSVTTSRKMPASRKKISNGRSRPPACSSTPIAAKRIGASKPRSSR